MFTINAKKERTWKKRKKAKENKDYLLADKIREELLNKNIRLIDTKDNTTYEIINL